VSAKLSGGKPTFLTWETLQLESSSHVLKASTVGNCESVQTYPELNQDVRFDRTVATTVQGERFVLACKELMTEYGRSFEILLSLIHTGLQPGA